MSFEHYCNACGKEIDVAGDGRLVCVHVFEVYVFQAGQREPAFLCSKCYKKLLKFLSGKGKRLTLTVKKVKEREV